MRLTILQTSLSNKSRISYLFKLIPHLWAIKVFRRLVDSRFVWNSKYPNYVTNDSHPKSEIVLL